MFGVHTSIPTSIRDVNRLEQILSEPTEAAITAMSRIQGDVLLLGAGGKMGPSLARMVQRASDEANVDRQVIAVSRFTEKLVEVHIDGREGIRQYINVDC